MGRELMKKQMPEWLQRMASAFAVAIYIGIICAIPVVIYLAMEQDAECRARGGLMSRDLGCIKVQRPPPA